MNQPLFLSLIFLGFFGVGSIFQNCANHNFLNPAKSNSNPLPVSHPDVEPFTESSSSSIGLIDQKGVKSALMEIFLNEGVTEEENSAFSNLFAVEITMQQHMFGRPCDAIAAGTTLECGHNLNNLTLGMSQSSSTIREASRIQLCRRLLSRDGLLNPILLRLGGFNQVPNGENLGRAVQLFYPAWENHPEVVSALSNLDYQMARQGEPLKNRWALILSSLCDSPYWEIL